MGAEIRLSIAGSMLGYSVESSIGVRPTSNYILVPEVTNIPELASAEYDRIDMTPIDEQIQHQEITGLRQAPGTLTFEGNLSDTLLTFWNDTLVPAYEAAVAAGKRMWFVVVIKGMDKAYFFTAEPKVLAPSGGGAADGWKCTLPITMTNTPKWFAKPTISGANSVNLAALMVGTNVLTPFFSPYVTEYTANTTNTSDKIVAVAEDNTATVAIASEDATISDGTATWGTGLNTVTVTVTNGSQSKVYTLKVTKS